MKQVLISIRPEWLVKILNGRKTVELRKRFPKDFRGWMNLYCTKGKPYLITWFFRRYFIADYITPEEKDDGLVKNGKVVGRVWVDNVEEIVMNEIENCDIVFNNYDSKGTDDLLWKMSISFDEFLDYHLENRRKGKNRKVATSLAIYFSKLEIFDKPKELGELKTAVHYPKNIIQIYLDYKPLTKAPQSWQYVEVEQ